MTVDDRRFHLFACNIPVEGASRSILCDLQRREYYRIDALLYGILTRHQGKTVGEIRACHPEEEAEAIEDAFDYLVREELGFWLEEEGDADRFPPLDLGFEAPERINNAIIDVARASRHDFDGLFRQLDELACKHVELRFYDAVAVDALDEILEPTLRGRLRSVQILMKFSAWTGADFDRLFAAHARISSIIVHSSPPSDVVRTGKWPVAHVEEPITSSDQCGQIHPAYFSTCISTFTEAQQLNTCLNKKIGIDVDGNIKNCPSCAASHGHAASTTLREALDREGFDRLGRIHHDQVEVCRDCEFRYICTGCRVFLTDESNPFSKPAKCSYDPYTGIWGAPPSDEKPKRRLALAPDR